MIVQPASAVNRGTNPSMAPAATPPVYNVFRRTESKQKRQLLAPSGGEITTPFTAIRCSQTKTVTSSTRNTAFYSH